jgi:hypothetical protein
LATYKGKSPQFINGKKPSDKNAQTLILYTEVTQFPFGIAHDSEPANVAFFFEITARKQKPTDTRCFTSWCGP